MTTTKFQQLNGASATFAAGRELIEGDFPLLERDQPRVLRLALNEAEAVAWQTGFPALLFPALALEKARVVAKWHERQKNIRRYDLALALAE